MYLNIRTEYSFKKVFGPIERIADWLAAQGAEAACISDINNTFGHVPWRNALRARGIKPVYGCTFSVVLELEEEKVFSPAHFSVMARSQSGLEELYALVRKAYDQFYYAPRLTYADLRALSADVAVIGIEGVDWELVPAAYQLLKEGERERGIGVAGQVNQHIERDEDLIAEILSGSGYLQPSPLLSPSEWTAINPNGAGALARSYALLDGPEAEIPNASMVRYPEGRKGLLRELALEGARDLGCDLSRPEYAARFDRELGMIEEKDYEDYFLIVADLVRYAKQHMLVGPARGSSAGSLVCYLLGITTIDPIPFDLLFERFIDINRADLPDIDIDFPDSKRHLVIEYLEEKYGTSHVAHIGTISTLTPKAAINLFAKAMAIPMYEVSELKDAIIERSTGDARAAMCIEDTLGTDVGAKLLERYPNFGLVAKIEGHALHSGTHAAGVIVCNEPISDFGGVDSYHNVMMLDKGAAESLNLLKIDILGLRTLSVLEECLETIGQPYSWLYTLPLDDPLAFQVFNDMKIAGIFQFEGYALQSLTRQMGVHEFNDISAITALARPGPLHNGGATEFVKRRTGAAEVTYYSDHPVVKKYTQEELGAFLYQEQIMSIGREFGGLSWEDVSELRKAMSKSYGEEFFGRYREQFIKGATSNAGISAEEADVVWKNMVTFGSWGFNKSHAVGYGIISYWCAYLKAHHPLEFAKGALNNSRTTDDAIRILRDLDREYVPFDPERSEDKWIIQDGQLIGPLTALHGIGAKKAQDIMRRRREGEELTPGQLKLMADPVTPFHDLYPAHTLWGDYYDHPEKYLNQGYTFTQIDDIQEGNGEPGTVTFFGKQEPIDKYVFIGKLVDRNLRDHNEYGSVVKRGYEMKGQTLFLNLTLEDDSGSIICTIQRNKYLEYGAEIAEGGRIGEDWYLVSGYTMRDWRRIYVNKIRRLSGESQA